MKSGKGKGTQQQLRSEINKEASGSTYNNEGEWKNKLLNRRVRIGGWFFQIYQNKKEVNDMEITCRQQQLSKWGSPGLGTAATSPQLRTGRRTALKIVLDNGFGK